MPYSLEEFGQIIKTKYPQYQNIDNIELANTVLEKYPQYQSQVLIETETQPGYFERVGQKYKEGVQDIKEGIESSADLYMEGQQEGGVKGMLKKDLGLARGALRTTGEVAEQAFTPFLEAPLIKEGTEFIGEQIAQIPGVPWLVEKIDEFAESQPSLAKDLKNLIDIAALGFASSGSQAVKSGVQKGATKTGEVISSGISKTDEMVSKLTPAIKEALKPNPSPMKAVGEVLQGKTKDIASGVRGLSVLDVSGVKTFKDLAGKISNKIKELTKQVDKELSVDVAKRKLDELRQFITTPQGTTVVANPVKEALGRLKEVYEKIGDNVNMARIIELQSKATKQGLTNLEINNLAREFAREAGKAFSKTGEALTSMNAKFYENLRSQLKDFARQGIRGESAKIADETMHALINTERLIKNNIEAVNKLKQKIAERGLLDKFGHKIAKIADVATGGSLRGFIGGLLPRGAGYKTLNALDLEAVLQRNLKIIQDAIKSKNVKEMENILKKLNN